MSRALTIARREITSFFCTGVGWVVVALFLFVSAFLFNATVFATGELATMRPFFDWSAFLLLFIAPAISMRLISEETRIGTLESLMTAPVADWQVIFGKWLGAMGFFLCMLLPTFLFVALLEIYSNPDYGPILTGYLGLLFIGGLYLASGILASSLSNSQILAYLVALFFWLTFWGVTVFLPQYLPDPWPKALYWMSVNERFSADLGKGVLDTSTLVYFASGIAFFLIISTKVVESRRWR